MKKDNIEKKNEQIMSLFSCKSLKDYSNYVSLDLKAASFQFTKKKKKSLLKVILNYDTKIPNLT